MGEGVVDSEYPAFELFAASGGGVAGSRNAAAMQTHTTSAKLRPVLKRSQRPLTIVDSPLAWRRPSEWIADEKRQVPRLVCDVWGKDSLIGNFDIAVFACRPRRLQPPREVRFVAIMMLGVAPWCQEGGCTTRARGRLQESPDSTERVHEPCTHTRLTERSRTNFQRIPDFVVDVPIAVGIHGDAEGESGHA